MLTDYPNIQRPGRKTQKAHRCGTKGYEMLAGGGSISQNDRLSNQESRSVWDYQKWREAMDADIWTIKQK